MEFIEGPTRSRLHPAVKGHRARPVGLARRKTSRELNRTSGRIRSTPTTSEFPQGKESVGELQQPRIYGWDSATDLCEDFVGES